MSKQAACETAKRKSRRSYRPNRVPFFASVKFRLTRWYFCLMLVMLFMFVGSAYKTLWQISSDAAATHAAASQEAARLTDVYQQILLHDQQPQEAHVSLPSEEIVLLLSPDGGVLDKRGPLTENAVRLLQKEAGNRQPVFNKDLDPTSSGGWWHSTNSNYSIMVTPILDGNTRIATLMVGRLQEDQFYQLNFWVLHVAIVFLLVIAVGGYWMAGRAIRPVREITQMAQEINATDLRRRLGLRHRDEFGLLASTFDQMLARLEAAFKRQTQFTADASHELRTPLTIINLEINRALTQAQSPEEYRQILEQIQAENEQMTAVVNSLLLLARADTGQMELHREQVDLSDLALACVERLWSLAQQKHIKLSTGELPELLVSGDPQHLTRMIMNLLENAIKYTSGVGRNVRVDLTCEEACWAVLRVRDDGPGIAEEHLPYLFERFYRVDKARSRHQREQADTTGTVREEPGGTGLGLSIVQWVVQAHGGEVRVESKMGVGSLFEVRLPLAKDV